MMSPMSAWWPRGLVLADFASSLDAFLDAIDEFFANLAAVKWGALVLALAFQFAHVTLRSRAWFNTLRAAYPEEQFRFRRILGAYVAGVGVNSVVPIRGGDVLKIYLAKHSVRNSTYPAVTSSFFVESIFDISVGALVMLFAVSQGVLPTLPELPNLPAFDLSFWAEHFKFAMFTMTVVVLGLLIIYAVVSVRAVVFWRRVRQGVVIVTDFKRYLRQVALVQAGAWLMRFFCFFFFLEAFNVGGTVENALLVMSVQALSTLTPFTPGGAGAQQALLVFVFRDIAPRATVLAYSVGQQVAIAVFNLAAALVALFLMAGTLDFRKVIKTGEEEKRRAEGAA
ncbi:MAG: lysylphosphatidylglycerol synthase transmembrane domain-containing protein [Solirubrobacterales bacterium]